MAGGLTDEDFGDDDEPARTVTPETSAASVLELYTRERAAADAVIAATDLDAAVELLDGRQWMVL